jgi:hypothetical protein
MAGVVIRAHIVVLGVSLSLVLARMWPSSSPSQMISVLRPEQNLATSISNQKSNSCLHGVLVAR